MIDQLPDKWAVGCLLTIIGLLYTSFSFYQNNAIIKRLGGRAPRVRGFLPWGIDLAYKSLAYTSRYQDLEFWALLFSKLPPGRSRTIEMSMAGQRYIFTADPENIKAILAAQFDDYGKGEIFHKEWKDFLGDSIFTTDGEEWRNSRSLIRPQFAKARVSDLEIFEKHVNVLMGMVGGNGEEVDISELFYRYTLDAATEFLLGKSVDTLENPQAEFSAAFAEVQRIQNMVSRIGPLNVFLPRKTFWAGLESINNFVNPFIDRALRLGPSILEENVKSAQGYNFLHALAGFTQDRKVLRDQIVAVLLAGRDTTAGTLSFCFQELSRNPQVVAKLRREIFDRVGPNRQPTYDDLKNMPYLQHTMNETLRMYPAIGANVRSALHDTTLPHGGGPDGLQPIGIRKDTPIAYSTIFMQRDAQLFPPPSAEFPDLLTFSPERWDNWIPKSWHYVPFNAGPRLCIGQQFALTEISYTIVRILQKFEKIDKYWPDSDAMLKSEIVLSPAKGVKVGFWAATPSEKTT